MYKRQKLNKKIIAVTKGWTDAYYNIFLTGEADLVLSYTTSPAAHIMFEENYDFSAINFEEGNYLTIEFAGILKSSKNKEQAKKFNPKSSAQSIIGFASSNSIIQSNFEPKDIHPRQILEIFVFDLPIASYFMII